MLNRERVLRSGPGRDHMLCQQDSVTYSCMGHEKSKECVARAFVDVGGAGDGFADGEAGVEHGFVGAVEFVAALVRGRAHGCLMLDFASA